MINFCHISPTAYLKDYARYNGAHLILAHLVESDPVYRDFYVNLMDGKAKIMDNGAYEMFKQGRPMYPTSKLVEMARACRAHYVVMSDYPKQAAEKTIRAATDMMTPLAEEGFMPFFCPQSPLGDLDGLIQSIEWALDEPRIKMIGISILNAPIALGVEEKKHTKLEDQLGAHPPFDVPLHAETPRDESFRLQRFLSRWKLFNELRARGILSRVERDVNARKRSSTKVFHCLGMVDGPNEVSLLHEYGRFIFSWDSSAAIWSGLHGISFDSSPTGLRYGKFEKEVDFNHKASAVSLQVVRNISYINRLCEGA